MEYSTVSETKADTAERLPFDCYSSFNTLTGLEVAALYDK